jgi:hypothetical protein
MSHPDRWITSICSEESAYVFVRVLREGDMMMFLQRVGDDFPRPAKLVSNATNTRFAALHTSQLLYKFLPVCAFISTFGSLVLKFALMTPCQCQKHRILKLLTGSVEIESNVPK